MSCAHIYQLKVAVDPKWAKFNRSELPRTGQGLLGVGPQHAWLGQSCYRTSFGKADLTDH
jgi:hypothetical protein